MKAARQTEIIKLIHEYEIGTQEELVQRLNDNGYRVTQATVSRDIRELKLTKVQAENGHIRYAFLKNQEKESSLRYVRVLKDSFASMEVAENILVIKTAPGMAMAAAAVLDEMNWSEIVGCIAGDNTIMCAIRSRDEAIRVMEKLKKMLEKF